MFHNKSSVQILSNRRMLKQIIQICQISKIKNRNKWKTFKLDYLHSLYLKSCNKKMQINKSKIKFQLRNLQVIIAEKQGNLVKTEYQWIKPFQLLTNVEWVEIDQVMDLLNKQIQLTSHYRLQPVVICLIMQLMINWKNNSR